MAYIAVYHTNKNKNLTIAAIEVMDDADPWGALEAFEPEMYDMLQGRSVDVCDECPRGAFEPYDADALEAFLEE